MSGKMVLMDIHGQTEDIPWGEHDAPPWKIIRNMVGGWLAPVKVNWEGKVREAYVDEEGNLKGLPLNRSATTLLIARYYGTRIVGKMVIWVPDPKPKGVDSEQGRKHRGGQPRTAADRNDTGTAENPEADK